jgi:hypothetical protein
VPERKKSFEELSEEEEASLEGEEERKLLSFISHFVLTYG